MPQAISIGPLLLPLSLLLVIASAGAAVVVGQRSARTSEVDVESALWATLLVGFVVARLAFVYEFRAAYLASPLDIVDIRDGGWSPMAGIVGAWLFALSRQRRQPALRRPLQRAMFAGTALYVAGHIALALSSHDGRPLPPLQLTTLDGQTVRLDAFVGKPTVVNLWATWCPPCVREMPVLQQAQAERADVNIVFVNQGESADKVRAWLAARRLTLNNVLIDGRGQASAAFDQKGLPTTLFFDARGQLVSSRIGELSAATLREKIAAITR